MEVNSEEVYTKEEIFVLILADLDGAGLVVTDEEALREALGLSVGE